MTRALLRSGAPIGEVNTVRKHLSRIKGGRLARAGQRAEIVTLAISDVPMTILRRSPRGRRCRIRPRLRTPAPSSPNMSSTVDDAVRRALDDPANESCKPGDAAFARARFELIARPRGSLDAAIKARARGRLRDRRSRRRSRRRSARCRGRSCQAALQARTAGQRIAILSGGELTVTVRGNGHGGPNQEYALALAEPAQGRTLRISALGPDTDGADGGAGSASGSGRSDDRCQDVTAAHS